MKNLLSNLDQSRFLSNVSRVFDTSHSEINYIHRMCRESVLNLETNISLLKLVSLSLKTVCTPLCQILYIMLIHKHVTLKLQHLC